MKRMALGKSGFWIAAMIAVQASGSTLFVSPTGSHESPFASWETASTNLESAIQAASAQDTIVVASGTYAPESTLTLWQPLHIQSELGSGVSIIDGSMLETLFSFQSPGSVLEGFTLRNGSGISLLANESTTLLNCVLDGMESISLAPGSVLDGCVVMNTGSIRADESSFSSCTFYADEPMGAPLLLDSRSGPTTNRFSGCSFRDNVCLDSLPIGFSTWIFENSTLESWLNVQSAVLQGTLTGPGSLSLSDSVLDQCTIDDLVRIDCQQSWFSNCTFNAAGAEPTALLVDAGNISGNSYFSGCTFREIVRLNGRFAPDIHWTIDNSTIEGTLYVNSSVLHGTLSGPGWLELEFSTLDQCTVDGLSRIGCQQSTFNNSTFYAADPSSAPLQLVAESASEITHFSGCTFRENVAIGMEHEAPSTWVLENSSIEGTLTLTAATAQGVLSGPGTVEMNNAILDQCTILNLSRIACQQASFSNCIFYAAAMPGPVPLQIQANPLPFANTFANCTFRDSVQLDALPQSSSIWAVENTSIEGSLSVSFSTVQGTLTGQGQVSLSGAILDGCTVSNLNDLVADDSDLTGCVIMHGPGRGVRLYNGSTLVRSRIHHQAGGGALCSASEILNCEIHDNQAAEGGGVYVENNGRISACTIVSNFAGTAGGGIYSADFATVDNSICYFNVSPSSPNWYRNGEGGTWEFLCTSPLAPGRDCFDADPLFLPDSLQLAPGSPCIDAGLAQSWMLLYTTDLAGQARIINTRPDLGASEFAHSETDFDGDGIDNATEQSQYGTNPLESDTDADGLTDPDELVSGTSPTSESSNLEWGTNSVPVTAPDGVILAWPSVTGRIYTLIRSCDLTNGFADIVASNLPATPPLNIHTDTTANASQPYFYRVSVKTE